jgi:NAD-dependent SIR2 family protein deacetylase
MHYTENEETFWKYHSMGCGYSGDFEPKSQCKEDLIIYICPVCGSEYRPEQEHEGETWTFAGDSVDMFSRATDEDLIEELQARGYDAKKRPSEFWKK